MGIKVVRSHNFAKDTEAAYEIYMDVKPYTHACILYLPTDPDKGPSVSWYMPEINGMPEDYGFSSCPDLEAAVKLILTAAKDRGEDISDIQFDLTTKS